MGKEIRNCRLGVCYTESQLLNSLQKYRENDPSKGSSSGTRPSIWKGSTLLVF